MTPASTTLGESSLGRLAAIDVGTNTVRLVVADVRADRTFRIVDDEKVATRLGRGLADRGELTAEAIEETVEAIAKLASIADGYGVSHTRPVATCAVREATNGHEFVARVRERTGLDTTVISAEDEGRLAFLSVAGAFDLRGMPAAVIDVGGGSTELVLSSGTVIERIYPLPMGAVRLTDQFALAGTPDPEKFRAMRQWIKKELEARVGRVPFVPHLVVGTGGTFTNLASIVLRRGEADIAADLLPGAVRGFEMQRSDVKHVLHLLRKIPPRERARVPGLTPDRADIIVAGITIVDCLLKQLQVNRLRVHDQGIRAGLLQTMIDERFPREGRAATVDRMRSVQRLAKSCPHDGRHAAHVTRLSLSLFDELAAIAPEGDWATAESRELLEAAAMLHDIGYFISYERHHKHSYHLILHSGLEGFTRAEIEIIGAVARYHRGARPKMKHRSFGSLSPADRERVLRLAGILRLAVGLDRSHAQIVRTVSLRRRDDHVEVRLAADREPVAELWGAERKADILQRAFGVTVGCVWAGRPLRKADTDAEADTAADHRDPRDARPARTA